MGVNSRRARGRRPSVAEVLERRRLLAAVSVSTLADVINGDTSSIASLIATPGADGISYREALSAANNSGGADVINFSVGGTINVLSNLPTVTSPVSIIASSSGTPTIELNGAGAGPAAAGLQIFAGGAGSIVRGLVINRFAQQGIFISSSNNNVIAGCYIGTNLAGTADLGNGFTGIFIQNSTGNTIGGMTPQDRNVISGNVLDGIYAFNSPSTKIHGNYLGTSADGNDDLGNTRNGVGIDRSPDCIVGGDDDDDGSLDGTVASRNVISGNSVGVSVFGSTAVRTLIQGNYIGTKAGGTQPQPNSFGVLLTSSADDGTPSSLTTVGGTTPGAGNVISGNSLLGLRFFGGAHHNTIQGNLIGTTADGVDPLPNGTGALPAQTDFGFGINVSGGAAPHDNTIGGDDDDDGTLDGNVKARNIISGNFKGGIKFTLGNANAVEGNYIGLNASGNVLSNNGPGVLIGSVNSSNNRIGGGGAGAGNTISGNTGSGVVIRAGATQIFVLGNRIGTDPGGALARPNGDGGVLIDDSPNNYIGEPTATLGAGAGNVISGNTGDGIMITGLSSIGNNVQGNMIGTTSSGTERLPNSGSGVRIVFSPSNFIGAPDLVSGGTLQRRNLISGNDQHGIHITSASNNELEANHIGLVISGAAAARNLLDGVFIESADHTLIGPGNVISGNTRGVVISGPSAQGTKVQGSSIGTDVSGMFAVPNDDAGILLDETNLVEIGGNTGTPGAGQGNLISGNGGSGVRVSNNSSEIKIQGNMIGRTRDGASPLGNGVHGVDISDSIDTTVGGDANQEANVIASNGSVLGPGGHGVSVNSGTRNKIRRNSIYSNSGRGIDLGDDSFTRNDENDLDNGANTLQNYPFVRSVNFIGGGMKEITFQLSGGLNESFTFDFYSVTEPDPSGFGEGKTYLAAQSQSVSTDADANAIVTITVPVTELYVSATATDSLGNTSEFSMVDTDADGLADAWETGGIDINEDGTKDHFYADANPMKKDIYVEIDAMDQQYPHQEALDDVVAAFADAPAASVDNPDGSAGIALHPQNGGDTSITRAPWKEKVPGSNFVKAFDQTKAAYFGSPLDRLLPNWTYTRQARLITYRYCVFAHSLIDDEAGGIAEDIPANDFFVALAKWKRGRDRDVQASSFMHELGHTLGLGHGGGDRDDSYNFKPNYFSIMNYLWAAGPQGDDDYRSSWVLDYSRLQQPDIDEDIINELSGLGGDSSKVTPIGPIYRIVPAGRIKARFAPQGGSFDFDDDGNITSSVGADINFLGDMNDDKNINGNDFTPGQILEGHDDWSSLYYSFDGSGGSDYSDGMGYDQFLLQDSFGVGPGVFEFSHLDYDAQENAGSATITVVRAGGTDGAVSVQYQTVTGGSANPGTDYTTTSGTLNFADGEYLKAFTIPLVNNSTFEGSETVSLRILNPVGAALGDVTTATLEITEPMVATLVNTTLAAPEAGGTLPITVVLRGETGQTLSEAISLSLKDLLSGSALAGVDYELGSDATVSFPAGTPVGTTRTLALTLIDDYASDADRTIDLSLAPIDSFAAVSAPDMITIRILDGAVHVTFDTEADYTDNFRETYDPDGFMGYNAGGFVRGEGGNWTTLYDTTPLDGAATVDLFGGGTSKEVYSVDFRSMHGNAGAGIYARVPTSSTGGYFVLAVVQREQAGPDFFQFSKNPSIAGSEPSETALDTFFANFANPATWYTLVFTVQTNAAGTEVTLTGQVFPQGHTGGTPLAEFSTVDSDSPFISPGQAGFQIRSHNTGDNDVDNFTADASLAVNAGESEVLAESHYLTSVAVNGDLTLSPGGNKVLVTRELGVTGRLDLTDNDLIVTGMSYGAVESLVKSGFGNFDWLGSGITSSTAAAYAQTDGTRALGVIDNVDWGHATFGGQTVSSTDILVKFTYTADTNLDGLVDNDDFGQFLYGFNGGGSARWLNGDFDFNGFVDNDDFGLFLLGLNAFTSGGNVQL